MQLVYSYFLRYWKLMVLALLLATICQLMLFVDPTILRYLVDHYALQYAKYTTRQFMGGVTVLLLAGMAAGLLGRMAKHFQDYVLNIVSTRIGADLYSGGIHHSLHLPFAVFEDQKSGDTLGKLQKVRADVEKFVTVALTSLFTALFGLVFLTAYAFTVHWVVAVGFFTTLGIMSALTPRLSQRIKQHQKAIVAETATLAGATTESLRNIELVKSLGLDHQEISRLNALTENIVGLELKKLRSMRPVVLVQSLCIFALRASLMILMLYFVYVHRITVGQWLALLFYWAYIFGPLQDLGSVFTMFRETEASLEVYQAILSQPIERTPPNPVSLGSVESLAFEDVSFSYQANCAISRVSFSANRGETIAFVGPSGSGKTTLVKLLLGLYPPDDGCIVYNGKSCLSIDLNELRIQIGFVSQDTQLFSGTIRDNLLFVNPNASDEECLTVLKKALCDGLLQRADRGLDTIIGEAGIKISGGEKQRLSIARALLRDPRLLVFDEATSSLDSITEEEVMATIRKVASHDVITIVVAHRLSTVLHADMIHVLERGRIVEAGCHRDLLEKRGLYYAMWRQQVNEGSYPAEVHDTTTIPAAALG
jgi:ATP-binding cassette subfamily B protein